MAAQLKRNQREVGVLAFSIAPIY
ncbi:hypothetical protein CBM2606_A10141 [Cupriavidus taiwanensis]|nr:hypothetical protein CBM2606_A10141 [Cupriavidus taiwanensis]